MNPTQLASARLLSPAALRIVRRHRPAADDPRNCRSCGRPVAACDVFALALVVTADLQHRVAAAAGPSSRPDGPLPVPEAPPEDRRQRPGRRRSDHDYVARRIR